MHERGTSARGVSDMEGQPETSTMRSIAVSRGGNKKLGQHQVIPKLSWTNPGSPFGLELQREVS